MPKKINARDGREPRFSKPTSQSRLLDIRIVKRSDGSSYFEALYEKISRSDEDKEMGTYWAKVGEVEESSLSIV